MGLYEKISVNLGDVRTFGMQFLWRHSPMLTGAPVARVKIPDVGMVYLRPRESDASAIRQVFRYMEYDIEDNVVFEERVMKQYHKIIEAGRTPVVVDAGANIGAASLWFSKKYKAAAVVAVEPEHGNLRVLRENVKNEPRISVIAAAVGSRRGFVSVKSNGHGWSATTERSNEGVPIVTIDDATGSVMRGAPFIVKIDIEGFESELFSENIGWLNEVYVVVIEPHDWMFPGKMTSHSFQRALALHDFELLIRCGNLFYVRSCDNPK